MVNLNEQRSNAVLLDAGRGDFAAVENIETQRLWGLRLLLGVGRRETEGHDHSRHQNIGYATGRGGCQRNGNPLALAFPAQQNLSDALLAVSFIVVDAVPVRPALICTG
jgi:hypothetical protein